MAVSLLNDREIFPSQDVLQNALGENYYLWTGFLDAAAGLGLDAQWRYYNDGKSWLCKVVYKKNTIVWIAVDEGFFRGAIYFTSKYTGGVGLLDIDPKLKADFKAAAQVGKLIPFLIEIHSERELADLLKVASYKMTLK